MAGRVITEVGLEKYTSYPVYHTSAREGTRVRGLLGCCPSDKVKEGAIRLASGDEVSFIVGCSYTPAFTVDLRNTKPPSYYVVAHWTRLPRRA
jgi:hypothetical protein